jgi:CO/xanthine dehydrogenase Mo-binding subunit
MRHPVRAQWRRAVFGGPDGEGQGTDTVMAQIAATALGVAIDDVRVISGDTDAVPYGGGTFGSRALAIGGEAVHRRCS